MIKATIVLLALITLSHCERQIRLFQVTRRLHNHASPQQQKVAELTIFIDKQYNEASAEVQLVFEHLVDSQLFQNSKDVLTLRYANNKSGQVFMSTIKHEDLLSGGYKEVLSIIVNNNYDVVAINYSQQKLKRKELPVIEATVHKNQPGKDFVLTYVSVKKPGPGEAPEDQSFFAKYKWYILGFFMLVFMMSKADPESMQQQMQGQQAPAS